MPFRIEIDSTKRISTVAPVQITRHQCAGNRRTSQQKTLGRSASKLSAAGSASTPLGVVAMNALLCVPNVARPGTYKLATSTTRRITIYTNVSAKRAGRGRGPVPADPPLPRNPSQLRTKTQGTSKTCLLYTSPSPRDRQKSRMPSSA